MVADADIFSDFFYKLIIPKHRLIDWIDSDTARDAIASLQLFYRVHFDVITIESSYVYYDIIL